MPGTRKLIISGMEGSCKPKKKFKLWLGEI